MSGRTTRGRKSSTSTSMSTSTEKGRPTERRLSRRNSKSTKSDDFDWAFGDEADEAEEVEVGEESGGKVKGTGNGRRKREVVEIEDDDEGDGGDDGEYQLGKDEGNDVDEDEYGDEDDGEYGETKKGTSGKGKGKGNRNGKEKSVSHSIAGGGKKKTERTRSASKPQTRAKTAAARQRRSQVLELEGGGDEEEEEVTVLDVNSDEEDETNGKVGGVNGSREGTGKGTGKVNGKENESGKGKELEEVGGGSEAGGKRKRVGKNTGGKETRQEKQKETEVEETEEAESPTKKTKTKSATTAAKKPKKAAAAPHPTIADSDEFGDLFMHSSSSKLLDESVDLSASDKEEEEEAEDHNDDEDQFDEEHDDGDHSSNNSSKSKSKSKREKSTQELLESIMGRKGRGRGRGAGGGGGGSKKRSSAANKGRGKNSSIVSSGVEDFGDAPATASKPAPITLSLLDDETPDEDPFVRTPSKSTMQSMTAYALPEPEAVRMSKRALRENQEILHRMQYPERYSGVGYTNQPLPPSAFERLGPTLPTGTRPNPLHASSSSFTPSSPSSSTSSSSSSSSSQGLTSSPSSLSSTEPERIIMQLKCPLSSSQPLRFRVFSNEPFTKIMDTYISFRRAELDDYFRSNGIYNYLDERSSSGDKKETIDADLDPETRIILKFDGIPLRLASQTPAQLGMLDNDVVTVQLPKPAFSLRSSSTSAAAMDDGGGGGGAGSVDLKVRWREGVEKFRIKKSDTLKKLLDGFCNKLGFSTQQVKLMFDGLPLNLNSTPESEDMEDDDIIDASVTGNPTATRSAPPSTPVPIPSYSSLSSSSSNSSAGGEGGGDYVRLKVRWKAGEDKFKLKKTDAFKKLMDAFRVKHKLGPQQVKFTFDGLPLDPSTTPEDEDMEDDFIIDALVTS